MGILKNLLKKVKGIEDEVLEENKTEEIEPIKTENKNGTTEKKNQINNELNKKIFIMNPINYSLEKIANKVKLPNSSEYLLDELKKMSTKNNVGIDDIDNLNTLVNEEIDSENLNISNLKETYEIYLTLQEAISYIENFITQIQKVKFSSSKENDIDYQIYSECEIVTKFKSLEELLKQLEENFSEMELSQQLKSKTLEFIESIHVIRKSYNGLKTEIENLKKDGEALKLDIGKFTIALNKVKAMGSAAGVEEYYKQLNDSKEILNEKREEFLQEENRLNEYISIVDKSIQQVLIAFNDLQKPIITELKINIAKITDEHKETLDSKLNNQIIEVKTKQLESITELQNELIKCKNLHKKFL